MSSPQSNISWNPPSGVPEPAAATVDDHDEAVRAMTSVQEYRRYCRNNKINIYHQFLLACRNYLEVYDIDFSEELYVLLVRLAKQLATRNQLQGMLKQLGDEVVLPSAVTELVEVPAAEPPATIETFRLTDRGRGIDYVAWQKMVEGMARHLLLPAAEVEGYLTLWGVESRGRKRKPLEGKVSFTASLKTLAFWVAMMVGGFEYKLVQRQEVEGHVLDKGIYSCPPLVTAPRGQHWYTVAGAVQIYKHGQRVDISNPRQLITAKKETLPPHLAAPILALLEPLGCRRR